MKKYFSFLFIPGLVMMKTTSANAQKTSPHDTAYYADYPGSVTARVYLTQKYASLNFPSDEKDLRYTANTKLGAGVGATYHNFTLNLAYGISSKDEKGKTKGLDFQLHLFPYKWAADAIFTAYKGAYISPKGYGATNDMNFYVRPEVKLDFFGLTVYRVPNAGKFS